MSHAVSTISLGVLVRLRRDLGELDEQLELEELLIRDPDLEWGRTDRCSRGKLGERSAHFEYDAGDGL